MLWRTRRRRTHVDGAYTMVCKFVRLFCCSSSVLLAVVTPRCRWVMKGMHPCASGLISYRVPEEDLTMAILLLGVLQRTLRTHNIWTISFIGGVVGRLVVVTPMTS